MRVKRVPFDIWFVLVPSFDPPINSFSDSSSYAEKKKEWQSTRSPPQGKQTLTLFDPLSGDWNRDVIHPCPPSSYTLSLVTLLLIKKNVRARQGSRKAVSPLCPVRGHPDRAGYSSSLLALVDLHFAALLSQDGPLPTNCYSPSPGERKGRLLVTQRDKGGTGWLDTRTIFF